MTAVILPFPKEKRPTPGDSPEIIYAAIEKAQKERSEIIVDEIVSQLYNTMEGYGIPFDNENEQVLKGTALVVESLRALLFGLGGYTHPLQPIADSIFDVMYKRGQAPIVVISNTLVKDAANSEFVANASPNTA